MLQHRQFYNNTNTAVLYHGPTTLCDLRDQNINAFVTALQKLCKSFGIPITNIFTSWSLDAPPGSFMSPVSLSSTLRLKIYYKNLSTIEQKTVESSVFECILQSLIEKYCH